MSPFNLLGANLSMHAMSNQRQLVSMILKASRQAVPLCCSPATCIVSQILTFCFALHTISNEDHDNDPRLHKSTAVQQETLC